MTAQAGLCLAWSETPEDTYCRVVVHVYTEACTSCSKVIFGGSVVTHGSTVARTVMCRQDGRGRFPVLLDDLSKCRTNSQRQSQLS